jgi:hypothetical protein
VDLFHYTSDEGFKSIASSATWRFRAGKSAGTHPFGAYFTDYPERTPNLALKLRVPKYKIAFFFEFDDRGEVKGRVLEPIPGARGRHIFFSRVDYEVGTERQVACGLRHG